MPLPRTSTPHRINLMNSSNEPQVGSGLSVTSTAINFSFDFGNNLDATALESSPRAKAPPSESAPSATPPQHHASPPQHHASPPPPPPPLTTVFGLPDFTLDDKIVQVIALNRENYKGIYTYVTEILSSESQGEVQT